MPLEVATSGRTGCADDAATSRQGTHMAHKPETAVPRVGMERRWADLANDLNLTDVQKRKLEAFMSDLQDESFDEGAKATMVVGN